jgi:hypothetical protein
MMDVEQANSRLAALIARLHDRIDKDSSLAVVAALRAGDPFATFVVVCDAVTSNRATLPARHRCQVQALGEGLGVDRAVWGPINFYLAA